MAIFKTSKGVDPIPVHRNENPSESIGSETKSILPSTVDVEIPIRGTGNEIEKPVPGNIKPKRTFSSVQNFIDTTIGTSQLAKDIGVVTRGINGTINDIKSMIKDPRYAIFKVANLLTGENVIPVHEDMHLTDGKAENIFNKYVNDLLDQYKTRKALEPTDEEVRNRVKSPLLGISQSSPIEADAIGVTTQSGSNSSTQVIGYVPALTGYKNIQGLSIGTSHIWDVKIRNYFHDGLKSFAPPVPVVSDVANSLKDNFVPVISYTIDDYSTKSTDVDLDNESKIEVVTGIQKNNSLTLTFLEDDNYTWTRYFDWYLNNIYDRETHTLAPYKQSCLEVVIAVYNTKSQVHFFYDLLVIPIGFTKKIEGTSEVEEFGDVTVAFSIVGDIDL